MNDTRFTCRLARLTAVGALAWAAAGGCAPAAAGITWNREGPLRPLLSLRVREEFMPNVHTFVSEGSDDRHWLRVRSRVGLQWQPRQEHTFAEKVLSAMRYKFGGHVELPTGG